MIIAIDGPAASGKSTVAQALARELGLPFLDTGAMYRAVTLAVQRRGIDPADGAACTRVAGEVVLAFDAEGRISIDGEPAEPAIRAPEVNHDVSIVAAHAGVRAAIVPHQRAIAAVGGAVAEGRDTTTVVFPAADFKFFLVASAAERARRRATEEGRPEALEEYQAGLERRDHLDSTRADSPLRQAESAHRVETDGLGPDEVREYLLNVIRASPVLPADAGSRAVQPSAAAAPVAVRTTRGVTYRVLMFILRYVYAVFWRIRARGVQLVPEGGALIVSNHQSYLDIPLIAEVLRPRHVGFVARESLADSRILAFIMRQCGSVLVARDRSDFGALRQTIAHLRAGDTMAIFPEGTRTKDGTLGEFRGGALVAARRARVPIVPCAIYGSYQAWPMSRRLPRPRPLDVAFGPPIDPRSKDALERCRTAIAELFAELEAARLPRGSGDSPAPR